MSVSGRLIGERRSLSRALVGNILVAFCFFFALTTVILTHEFYDHRQQNLKNALSQEVLELASQIIPGAPHLGLDTEALRFAGDEGGYRYTVFDADGRALAGEEVIEGLQSHLTAAKPEEPVFFDLAGNRMASALVANIEGQTFVAVASTYVPAPEHGRFYELYYEIGEEFQWLIVGVFVILLAAILAARRSLKPLARASREANEIGPGTVEKRLSDEGLSTEIYPLVRAVNQAFDRLEQGYLAQQEFSSNVAHEVRTPLSVLRSSIDRIGDVGLRQSLSQDVHALEQIFEQLIDLSRAEAHVLGAFTEVDLHNIALKLAEEMGIPAMRAGKRLAVTGAGSVLRQGHPGLLSIALGNLMRNAINYSPEGSEIEVEVTSAPAGWRVLDRGAGIPEDQRAHLFHRFRRGATHGQEGSGIGLAIVKSVADAHGAEISILARDGGGSIFSFAFPAL